MITFEIRVLSPLHVGSGQDREVSAVRAEAGANGNVAPGVAAIQRDHDGRPHIPGATMKGLLRRLAVHAGLTDAKLFGAGPQGAESRGAVRVLGSECYTPGSAVNLPYADTPQAVGDGRVGDGVYVASGTRIEPGGGVAASSTLHHREVVAPEARFRHSVVIEVRGKDAECECAELRNQILKILEPLAAPAGVTIGSGAGDGDGRIQLKTSSLQVTHAALDQHGAFVARPVQVAVATPAVRGAEWVVELHCAGPFAVLDPAWPARRTKGQPQLRGQRRSPKVPELPGSSVAGALRACAAWLEALKARRDGGTPVRDRTDTIFRPRTGQVLTPVQRLFGVTGFRGLLEIASIEVASAQAPWAIASVKLDRFSGSPMSGDLFDTETHVETALKLTLKMEGRPGEGQPTAEDHALADRLVKDITQNGLMLGHGGNKGFGWFDRAEVSHGARAPE